MSTSVKRIFVGALTGVAVSFFVTGLFPQNSLIVLLLAFVSISASFVLTIGLVASSAAFVSALITYLSLQLVNGIFVEYAAIIVFVLALVLSNLIFSVFANVSNIERWFISRLQASQALLKIAGISLVVSIPASLLLISIDGSHDIFGFNEHLLIACGLSLSTSLLLVPAMLILLASQSERQYRRGRLYALASIVLFLLTVTTVKVSLNYIVEQRTERLKQITTIVDERLKIFAAQSNTSIQAFQSFYEASEYVSYKEFSSFAATVISQFESIQGVFWVPEILEPQRQKFEEFATAENKRTVVITDNIKDAQSGMAVSRALYLPIARVEPKKDWQQLLGLDLAKNTDVYVSIQQAKDSNEIVISRPVHLARDQKQSAVSLMIKAISNPELKGVLVAVIDFEPLFADILQQIGETTLKSNITISDISSREAFVLYQSGSYQDNLLSEEHAIGLFNLHWLLTVKESMGAVSQAFWQSGLLLSLIFLGALALQIVILLLYSHQAELNARLHEKSRILKAVARRGVSNNQIKDNLMVNLYKQSVAPLAAIHSMVKRLQNENLYKITELKKLRQSANQLTLLANTLKTYNYLKTPADKILFKSFSLNVALAELKTYVEQQVCTYNCRFTCHLPTVCEEQVIGDMKKLKQMVGYLTEKCIVIAEQKEVNLAIKCNTHQEKSLTLLFAYSFIHQNNAPDFDAASNNDLSMIEQQLNSDTLFNEIKKYCHLMQGEIKLRAIDTSDIMLTMSVQLAFN